MTAIRIRRDDGQITVMLVGFFLIVGLLAVVVVDASAAFLRRQSMNNLADGAALAAADGVQGEQVYTSGLGGGATVDPDAARRHVGDYLRATGAIREHPGMRWTVVPDGDSVRVRLTAPMALPLSPPGWGDRTQVAGEAAVVLQVE